MTWDHTHGTDLSGMVNYKSEIFSSFEYNKMLRVYKVSVFQGKLKSVNTVQNAKKCVLYLYKIQGAVTHLYI